MGKTTLDLKIDELNAIICSGAKYTHKITGIVFQVEKGKELINVDIDNNPIIFDDKFDVFLYHKVRDISYEPIQQRGKQVVYNGRATMDAICFTSFRNFHDILIHKLSEVHNVGIKKLDFDSYKILKNETGKDSFAFDKRFIFSLNYTFLFKADKCIDSCLY